MVTMIGALGAVQGPLAAKVAARRIKIKVSGFRIRGIAPSSPET
jgi:hypothetical protein